LLYCSATLSTPAAKRPQCQCLQHAESDRMHMRCARGWLTALSILATPLALRAQTVLHGTVVNATTGQAVAGATVGTEGSQVSATTDGAGRFALRPEKPVTTLTVSHPDFEPYRVSLASAGSPIRVALTPVATLPGIRVTATSPPSSAVTLTTEDLHR